MRHVLVIGELGLTARDMAALGLELSIFQKNELVGPSIAQLGARLFAFDYEDVTTSVAIARALHALHPIYGVIAFAETGAETAAKIREALGIPTSPNEAQNDAALRELVGMRDTPSPRSKECATIGEARAFAALVGWPVALEPRAGSGGDLNVVYVGSASELEDAWGQVSGAAHAAHHGALLREFHEVVFPDPHTVREPGICAIGPDLRAETLLTAFRKGIFPWPKGDVVLWHSPNPRAIFLLDGPPSWSRSLRRTLRKHPFELTVDQAFMDVVRACGATREETWVKGDILASYDRLFRLGWAHSVEVWEAAGEGRVLVGGIYGVAIGGLFTGESMFHTRTDASKIAFATLAERLHAAGFSLFDVQVSSDHLELLGCVTVPRREYLERLARALETERHFTGPTEGR